MITTFTSESVCAGHPDKICDQISDAIVDAALTQDPRSRVAVETLVTKNFVSLAGEVTTKGKLNYKKIVRQTIRKLGYINSNLNFTYQSLIIVDTYGGMARVGGGCFSGKDPTKVDRSGAYASRFLAKNIIAHGLAKKARDFRRPPVAEADLFKNSCLWAFWQR